MQAYKLWAKHEIETLNTAMTKRDSIIVNSNFEIRYSREHKWYEIRFFVNESEQVGIWSSVGYWTWDYYSNAWHHVQRFCLKGTGCYTTWEFAGKDLRDLDLRNAFYVYK